MNRLFLKTIINKILKIDDVKRSIQIISLLKKSHPYLVDNQDYKDLIKVAKSYANDKWIAKYRNFGGSESRSGRCDEKTPISAH
jgi:hypothetical protein